MRVKYIFLIIIIIAAGVVYYLIKTPEFSDFIRHIKITEEENELGGKTITKVGSKATLVEAYPKEYLPIIETGYINSYTLVKDKNEIVVKANAKIYSEEKSYEDIVKYYAEFFSGFEEFNSVEEPIVTGSDVRENIITCKKGIKEIRVLVTGPEALNKNKYTIEIEYGK